MQNNEDELHQALSAARSGDRARALHILLDLVNRDETNAAAWILLSQLFEGAKDRLAALEKALVLLPGDEKLLARRAALLRDHPDLSDGALETTGHDEIDWARKMAVDGRILQALDLLRSMSNKSPTDARVWLELAYLEPALPERIRAAEKAVSIEPDNKDAMILLGELQEEQKDPLLRGQHLEEQGKFDKAIDLYTSIVGLSRLPAERIEAEHRIANIHLRRESQKAHPVHPNLNLWRMTFGPTLLFVMMLLIQSGLKPAHIPLLALPGTLSVILGGLLVAITEMVPAHPRWVAWFGQPGSGDEPEMRRGLRLLGWAFLLAPYTVFMMEAGRRLGEMQASMLPGW